MYYYTCVLLYWYVGMYVYAFTHIIIYGSFKYLSLCVFVCVYIFKKKIFLVKFFNKHQVYFKNVSQRNQELQISAPKLKIHIFLIHSGQPTTLVAFTMQIRR